MLAAPPRLTNGCGVRGINRTPFVAIIALHPASLRPLSLCVLLRWVGANLVAFDPCHLTSIRQTRLQYLLAKPIETDDVARPATRRTSRHGAVAVTLAQITKEGRMIAAGVVGAAGKDRWVGESRARQATAQLKSLPLVVLKQARVAATEVLLKN
jgi:hypothetical protein